MKGVFKESLSVYPLSEINLDDNYTDYEKDSYGIDDVITTKENSFFRFINRRG